MLTPHGALVLVVDGGNMKLLRNTGSETSPVLHLLRERHLHNPRDHVTGSDAPGRSFQSVGPRRGAHQPVNHHQLREDEFGEQAVKDAIAAAGDETPLIVITPPHMLGQLRPILNAHGKVNLAAEIGKDLCHFSPSEVASFLHDWRG